MTAFPSTLNPSQTSQLQRADNAYLSQFGDGYVQISPAGINHIKDTWSLVFENLDSTDSSTFETFFASVGSSAFFTWTAPGDTSKTWRCDPKGYQKQAKAGNINTYTITVIQVF
jgi:phage-related protein